MLDVEPDEGFKKGPEEPKCWLTAALSNRIRSVNLQIHSHVFLLFRTGVCCILQIKSRTFLIGSGDGRVTLVMDSSSSSAGGNKRGKQGFHNPGVPKMVQEPTQLCLKEVIDTINIMAHPDQTFSKAVRQTIDQDY